MEPGKKRMNIVIDDELHRFVAEAIKEKIERSNKE